MMNLLLSRSIAFVVVLNQTIIAVALVGYEMIIVNKSFRASLPQNLSYHMYRALVE